MNTHTGARMSLIRVICMMLALFGIATAAFGGETIVYFHNDPAGSPAIATDANGLIAWRETYQPYGARLIDSAASDNNEIWFAGEQYDESTGLSYMGARYYDPMLGRFLSMDPMQVDFASLYSFNRYAYANDNPYRFVDPSGWDAEPIEGVTITARRDDVDPWSSWNLTNNSKDHDDPAADVTEWPTFADAFNERAVEFFGPLSAAADDAVDYWAEVGGVTGTVFGTLAATVDSNNIGNTTLTAGTAYLGGTALRGIGSAFGPLKQWIRVGPSYSKALGQKIALSIRWGASPAKGGMYLRQIGSQTMQRVNQWLRARRIPIDSWRTADPGHLHLRK